MRTTIIFIISLLALISTKNECAAQAESDTLKILFVGNSYTVSGNLPQIVSIISDSIETKLVTRKSTIGGAKLHEHWHGDRGLKTKELIQKGDFENGN